jgi:hypothetical protein
LPEFRGKLLACFTSIAERKACHSLVVIQHLLCQNPMDSDVLARF